MGLINLIREWMINVVRVKEKIRVGSEIAKRRKKRVID